MNAITKITSKSRTTVPAQIRKALHVGPGDALLWDLQSDGTARVRRTETLDSEYLRATEAMLAEWFSSDDEDAYRGL